ncbi:MBL fold metallo-hydrolase [Paenarthrobacter nitroguajacolicus]|uniref:MBL fold metallo-hydrolase n=1 Tax=Paenarthrobacter nitroguajacolicus TaxID=211146 RepID=UPI00248C5F07|nr:MBL fold metallo-hydrolase [Paenarthrobacter nitroguajacolicus]
MVSHVQVEPVIQQVHLAAGVAGPSELDFDVRCFVITGPSGLVLLDTGLEGSSPQIELALVRARAGWSDITDVILTHSHPDHVGGLTEVTRNAPQAVLWAGQADASGIRATAPIRPLSDNDYVRDLRVISTPGHTMGHISLLHEPASILFAGDVVGTMTGEITRAPSQFTADAAMAEESLKKLDELRADRMVFSHGPELTDPGTRLHRLVSDGPTPGN